MFSYFAHCIYSAIQLSSCKGVLNKLSCQTQLSVSWNMSNCCLHWYKRVLEVINFWWWFRAFFKRILLVGQRWGN